jgi:gamma-tubulin complex component 2
LFRDAIHSTSEKTYGKSDDSSFPCSSHGGSLKGMDAFTLAYRVRWPLSLIISKKTLTKYQLIFRHLFAIKHVERQLCATWRNHQVVKELQLNGAFNASFGLRHRMLHFMQNLAYYMMVTK